MFKSIFSFSLILFIGLIFSACKKNESVIITPLEVKTVSNLPADLTMNAGNGQPQSATGKFTLFSFKDNAQVANSDSATTKWDIGFRGTSIIVNGGAIRAGKGGAYTYTGLFDELKEIPAAQVFNTDQSVSILAIPTGSGNGWYNYNAANNIISPIAGRVFVIKTGDGKYAKVEILSYYKDAPASPTASSISRYFTFRYIYQGDGSTTF